RMKTLAAQPFEPVSVDIPSAFQGLDYDAYRKIEYRADASRWADEAAGYRLQAVHLGWLYNEPVKIFEIEDGVARPLDFGAGDFNYHDAAISEAAGAGVFPGVAGLRVNYPLSRPEALDELVSFLGASYFRALGRNNI